MKHFKKHWHTILVSMVWLGIFTALVACYAMRELLLRNRELVLENKKVEERLENCQEFVREVEKQVGSGRIILEMKEVKKNENSN